MKRFLFPLLLLGACGYARPSGLDPACPAGRCDWSPLEHLVDSAATAGAVPGVVVGIAHGGSRYIHGAGVIGRDNPAEPNGRTVYDLASLTKVVGLTTGVMLAVDAPRRQPHAGDRMRHHEPPLYQIGPNCFRKLEVRRAVAMEMTDLPATECKGERTSRARTGRDSGPRCDFIGDSLARRSFLVHETSPAIDQVCGYGPNYKFKLT